jgi:predicted nucleotidyltransferase
MNTTQITPYPDVNNVLNFLVGKIIVSLGKNLVGIYLFGSLTYGDFNLDRSDIDLIAVLTELASSTEIDGLRTILDSLKLHFPEWANRVEVSYTPKEMFASDVPPGKRPYFGDGKFWPDAEYGNEWLINNYLLYKHGVTLHGLNVKTILREPGIDQVKESVRQVFYAELEPIRRNKDWIADSHYQSYVVLNLCRILYSIIKSDVGSKGVATAWVISTYPRWASLIQSAQYWKYSDDFPHQDEVVGFIEFVRDQIENNGCS